MMTAPFMLAIDAGGDEFPVAGPTPRLSWHADDEAWSAPFELEAFVEGVAQAPMSITATAGGWVPWPWPALRSSERVTWRVRPAGAEWSPWHDFEAGLFDADWTADWVSPVEVDERGAGERGAHVLAVEVRIDEVVTSARLYATALGVYEAFVNGVRAGTAELSPGSTSYEHTLYAQVSDVTAAIAEGANRIEIVLSDGWYRGRVGAFRTPAAWGDILAARAELHLRFADGARRIVRTDDTWSSASSAVVRADLMGGQTTDFTVRDAPTSAVRIDEVSAPPISWSPAPPIRVVESRAAVAVHDRGDGVWVVDFGQNASGWVSLADLGPAGTRTTIQYGEYLAPSGDLSTTHLDSTRPGEPPLVFTQRDDVVSAGDGAVFEPHHTVHGFQYARVTRHGGAFDPDSIVMRVVHTDFVRAGTFACSDVDLTRLHELADWSFRGNAVDIPTDCPTRERLGWTGDYQIFAPTATRLYDVSGFTRKWLQSVRDDQLDDGRIANFSPDGRRVKYNTHAQFAMMTGSAGWGDAVVAVPWEMYTAYGDRSFLEDNWGAMRRWVDWALMVSRTQRHPSRVERSPQEQPHERYLWDGSFHWGEWIEPKPRRADGSLVDPVKDDPMAWFSADKGEVGTAFLYRSTRTLADVAGILGKDAEAGELRDLAERIRDAWRTEFLRADGSTVSDTQAAYVRALSFDLIPDDLRAAAAARLVALIHAAGGHLATGFLSTGDLLPTLVDTGYAHVAYEVLFQRSSPSWLHMVEKGATTIWEDWDGIDDDGVAHESLNHYSKGAVVRFLHTHLLGLRQAPGSIGWRSVIVEPVPTEAVTWASGTHESPAGTIAVEWRVEDGRISIDVDLPAGTSGTIVLPDGTTSSIAPGHSTAHSRMETR